jgi:hypothetical protein
MPGDPRDTPTPAFPEFEGASFHFDAPVREDVLPDGTAVLVIGDASTLPVQPLTSAEHADGAAAQLARLVEALLTQSGVALPDTESLGLTEPSGPPLDEVTRLLNLLGIDATLERGETLEDLAQHVERGASVLAAVNAGVVWALASHFDSGEANYTVGVVGVVRDAATLAIVGFEIVDLAGEPVVRTLSASDAVQAWSTPGGWLIVAER